MIFTHRAVIGAGRPARMMTVFAAVCSLALLAPGAQAQVIVDSHGFESPFFTTSFLGTGQLEGQTPATFNGTWVRTSGPQASTATIQTAVVASGNQAVRVNRGANSDDRWSVPVSGYPSGDVMHIRWSMRVEQTTGPADTFGPFFGVEAYDDDANAIGLLGSFGVDASTGDVLYQATTTGFFTETGVDVNFGQWNQFGMELNFLTKTYRLFFNGNPLGAPIGFVDEANVVGGLDEFTDGDISAIAAAGDAASLALTGTAYFDNFVVSEGAFIPEPGTGALGAMAAAALATLRRRQRCAA